MCYRSGHDSRARKASLALAGVRAIDREGVRDLLGSINAEGVVSLDSLISEFRKTNNEVLDDRMAAIISHWRTMVGQSSNYAFDYATIIIIIIIIILIWQ